MLHALPERIRRRIDVGPACWTWTGIFFKDGYPQIRYGGKTTRAHRLIYRLCVGEIPTGWCVMHSCDNPKCVNPKHLSVGTNADNMADRDRKHRQAMGTRNGGGVKINDEQAREILRLRAQGKSIVELGKQFGIHFATVARISRRETWKHVA